MKSHLPVVLGGLIAASAQAQAQAPAPLKIVGSFDLSGAAAEVGKDVLVGTQYAVEVVNRSGGVLGRQIVLEYQDNGTNPQRAINQANGLAQGGAVLLLTPQSSSSTLAVSKAVSAKLKVPTCAAASAADEITMRDFQPYIFSVTANNYMESQALATLLGKQPYRRYAILSADYAGGRNYVERFKEFLKVANPQASIVIEEYPKFGAMDYTASINKLLAAKPDYVYSILFGADLITFSKQASGVGFFKQIDNHFGALYDENTLKALGEFAAIGTDGTQRAPASYFMKGSPEARRYVDQFKARYGSTPSDWSTLGYDCVMTWAAAANAAKTTDADPVMQALREGTFQSPRGSFTFSAYDHQADVPVFLGKVEYSQERKQPIVSIHTVVPGSSVHASEALVRKARGE
ncbi:ABC transporter substrate-binding protein [Pseudorhodoferax sp.]|uniref:ABC transporter substrate-binding protein n=1 Tax=Pseudorhodoferax sp. TaxID=1993553 RepID=UPI0039E3EBB0